MTDTEPTESISAMRAVAHPVRLRILSLLTGAAMSAAEIARELDISHANASYHLRFLAEAGTVVEAGEEKIRGGTAKRYRHPWDARPVDAGPPPSVDDRVVYVAAMGQELERRYRHRKPETRTHLTDAEMWVTPDVWEKVTALVHEAATLLHAEAKPPRTDGTIHVNMTAAVFEMTDAERGGKDDR